MARRWSLSRRMTTAFTLTTVGLVAAISLVSAAFLQRSISRELDGLVAEELDEVRAIFSSRQVTDTAFAEVTAELNRLHSGVRMAWVLFGQGPPKQFGDAALLVGFSPPGTELGRTYTTSVGRRWRLEDLRLESLARLEGPSAEPALQVGLLVDGRERLDLLARYGMTALALVGAAALLAILGGALFSRRVASLLRQVADSADVGELERAAANAPEEVAQVAQAFAATLGTIRAEGDRARLLVAGMAHELRSPIQNLLAETEVTLMRARDNEEYQRVLASHVDELRDLGRVVDNLVTLCATRNSPGRERFDLGEELDLRLERERTEAERAQVELALQTRGDLHLMGDREAIVLVVRNLVGNAISFSPAGCAVRVEVHGRVEEVTVTVDDAGPGVPEAERERIFEPFHRGPSPGGRRTGYGLGLALARSAVGAHGGEIEVTDSPEGGARFRVRLPREGVAGA